MPYYADVALQQRWYMLDPPDNLRVGLPIAVALALRVGALRTVVGQLDGASSAMTRARLARRGARAAVDGARRQSRHVLRRKGGPVSTSASACGFRASSRAARQIAVRVIDAAAAGAYHVAVCAGQWNVGRAGAPPAEAATPVAGDPQLYSAELWFMTPTSYQVFVTVDGPSGQGTAIVPVLALATAERSMDRRLGLVSWQRSGCFSTVGLLTIIGAAVRESVLPPGVGRRRRAPAARTHRDRRGGESSLRSRCGAARAWWSAEAADYGRVGVVPAVRVGSRGARDERRSRVR